MNIKPLSVRGFEISQVDPTLDPVTVYFQNFELGKGRITVECFGSAWSAYFGAMGGNTIEQFVKTAGVDYLANKLCNTPTLKKRKLDEKYLMKIVAAVKRGLNEEQLTNAN